MRNVHTTTPYSHAEASELGHRAPVPAWQVAPAATAGGPAAGGGISRPGYPAAHWYVAPARSTVMATLLANGLYPGLEVGRAMEAVDRAQFKYPWWYRADFDLRGAGHTFVRLDGVLHKADLWVNGTCVAKAESTAGAYTVSQFDVSGLVGPGANSLALCVYPGDPQKDFSISFVDWAQPPPDHNMGPWRHVVIERTGDVRLGPPAVHCDLALPGLQRADVRTSFEVTNLSEHPAVGEVRVALTGPNGENGAFGRQVGLAPRQTTTLFFGPDDTPVLRLEPPAVWWPVGEGAQALYTVHISVAVDGALSDQRNTSFGARSVTSYVAPGGGRRFVVNGRALQVIGGGWSPDLFLRPDAGRLAVELGYALDMGLNAVRLEGKLESEEFFDMTDALGLMVVPGWECCSKWEQESRDRAKLWTEHDFEVAGRQAASEAVLLRNHPSVICFMIGSDYAPPERTAQLYVDAFTANGWELPLVSSATAEGTDAAGPSGMKMTGPYSYVPPAYWYSTKRGGAIGFNSETSAGSTIPGLGTLKRMLSPDELEDLWRRPQAKQYHAGPSADFDNLAAFHRALAGRYGRPTSLEDFVRKAHLANYETVRAQFEAYRSRAFSPEPATGVIYWMLNSPWPSLNWQLYDWYLATPAAYFATKKANSTVSAVYAYNTGAVLLLNRGPQGSGELDLDIEVRGLDGAVLWRQRHNVADVPAGEALTVASVPVPAGAAPTYFLALRTTFALHTTPVVHSTLAPRITERAPGRNVYWLSTAPDILDWDNTSFHATPVSQYADLRALERLSPADIEAEVRPAGEEAGPNRAQLHLRNTGTVPALGLQGTVLAGPGLWAGAGVALVPTRWDDNYVTVFPGEEVQLEVSYPRAEAPELELGGFNLEPRRLAL